MLPEWGIEVKSKYSGTLRTLLVPRYDECALFLMSVAFILLFVLDATLRRDTGSVLSLGFDPRDYLAIVGFTAGIVFSVYHVFAKRDKKPIEKVFMLFFAVVVNAYSGIAAGIHILRQSQQWLMPFPIWNIANGVLLLVMYRTGMLAKTSIPDENANPYHVLMSSAVLATLLLVCHYWLQFYWAVTFSICVGYATTLNAWLGRLFSKTSPAENAA